MKQLMDARNYVQYWFGKSGTSVREAAKSNTVFGTMYLDYQAAHRLYSGQCRLQGSKPAKAVSKDELQYALVEFIEAQVGSELKKACSHLSYTGNELQALGGWLKCITGANRPNEVAVVAQFLWLVKRKSLGLPVKHHIMPVFYGLQGAGKSWAIVKLLQPIDKFRLNLKMNSLADDRNYKAFSTNLVVFFDELQNIERTDLNVLKNQVTTEFNTYRPLHTNNTVNAPMMCSFIGASNKPINENFSDNTGMRRFYQVDTLNQLDWDAINSFDYESIWKGIDELNNEGYLVGTVLKNIQEEQSKLVNKDDLSEFMEQTGMVPQPGDNTTEVSYPVLFMHYQDWCAKNGVKSGSGPWFSRKLCNRIKWVEHRNDSRTKVKFFIVSEHATILSKVLTLGVAK